MEREESNKQKKALNQKTRINMDLLEKDVLRKRIQEFESDIKTARNVVEAAEVILSHRDGTLFEDLAFVDSIRHSVKINKDYDYYDEETGTSACVPNKPMYDMLDSADEGTIIGVHNHPQNSAPSPDDIMRCYERSYKYGLSICHNGVIYKYSVTDIYKKERIGLIRSQLDKLTKSVNNKDEDIVRSAVTNLKEKGVIVEVYR